MSRGVRVLRSTPYDREIGRLAVPAFGALVAPPLYVLVDTAVVGHLGTPQLGGLAVASAVLLGAFTLFIFLAYGTTAAVARLIGAGEEREAAHQGVQSMWLALVIGLVVTALGFVVAEPLVHAFGGAGEVAGHALVYLRVSLPGLPALLLVLAGTGYLRGLQDTRTPLVVAVATAVANLAIELVLIYGLGYGIGASALATVVAEWGAAAVYVARVARAARALEIELRPHPASIRRLAIMGRDLAVRTIALRGALTVATAVAARIGTEDVAAHQIALSVWSLLALALDAVAIAGQAMVGRLLGAGDAGSARAASTRMTEIGVLLGTLCLVLVVVLRPVVPDLFTEDPAVVSLAGFLLWLVAALQPVNAVVFVLDGVLIGAGDMRYLAVATTVATLVFVPAAGLVLALDLGIGWVWAAIGLWMTARLVTLTTRFRTERWAVTGALR